MQLIFGDFALDTDRFELRNSGALVSVEPKVLDFLAYLAANPDRIVTKDEIIDAIWGGRIVSEATISGCVKSARRAVGDSGQSQRVIKTVHGRGFRFVASVDAPSQSRPTPRPQIFVQPSLIVLPVRTPLGDQTLATAGIPIADSLVTALARVPFLTVVSNRVSSDLVDKSLAEMQQAVGPGYLLDIGLRKTASATVATVQLSETKSGGTVWAHQFEMHGDTNICDAVLHETLPWLEPALVKSMDEMLRADPNATGSKPLLIRALGVMATKGWHGGSFSEAEAMLRDAVRLEPDLAMANASLGFILALGQKVGFAPPSSELMDESIAYADKALALDDVSSSVLGMAGCALADAGQTERAFAILNRALAGNPANAQALAALGSIHLYRREHEDAVRCLDQAISVSPFDKRLVIWRSVLALVHMKMGDTKTALQQAQLAVQADDRTYFSRVVLTAVHLSDGDRTSGIRALADCLRLKPELSLSEVSAIVGDRLGAKILDLRDALR